MTSTVGSETIESFGTQSQLGQHEDLSGNEELIDEEEINEFDLTGRILADRYQIESKLGAGSFGQVYLCQKLSNAEKWAMKIEMHSDQSNPQLFIEVVRTIDFHSAHSFFFLFFCSFLEQNLYDSSRSSGFSQSRFLWT